MKIQVIPVLISGIFLLQGCTKRENNSHTGQKKDKDFSLSDITSSGLLNLIGSHKNKSPVLVNMWATWCQPCIEELPHLLKLRKEYAGKIEFIFVSFDFAENRAGVSKFLRDQGVAFNSYFKNENDQVFLNNMPERWTGALPYTMIYSREGSMQSDLMGAHSREEFRKFIEQVL